ncbi:MAG: DUF4328 domain-containing protein [Dermatophilaceae bacterium]
MTTTDSDRQQLAPASGWRPGPGWYVDPEDDARLRKWDGHAWTDAVMRRAPGSAAPVVPALPAAVSVHAPPAWRPDPASADRARWWNGSAWTDRVRPGRVHPGRPALGPGFGRLATWVQVSAVVAPLGGLAQVVVDRWYTHVLAGGLLRPGSVDDSTVRLTGVVSELAGLIAFAGYALAFAMLVSWLWQAYGCDLVDPGRLTHSRGWVLGSWFVPFLNLVRPYRIVADVRDAAPPAHGPVGVVRRAAVACWWWAILLALGCTVVGAARSAEVATAPTPGEAVVAMAAAAPWQLATALAGLVAAAFLVVAVRDLTARLHPQEFDEPLPTSRAGSPSHSSTVPQAPS